jgi:CBS domain containing-hemolysin-like protein/mannitol/fructose-specific phosphotransferase system IIA component
MGIAIYLITAFLLLLLNAFFTLAEFTAIKARPSFMEVLAAKGNRRAKLVMHIQTHLDEFLSVCQVGITLASIGIGFVGEPAFAELVEPLLIKIGIAGIASKITSHTIAIIIAFILVSYLQIMLGELLPKSVAIRRTERVALLTAYPLMAFRYLFLPPIWLLNSTVNVILRLIRFPLVTGPGVHTQDEIRVILNHSQSSGMLSFRQLLHIENVLDMGVLTVKNAMRVRRHVRCLSENMNKEEIIKTICENRFSRYPLFGDDPDKPKGYVHIKDLFLAERAGKPTDDLGAFTRPCLPAHEEDALEHLLSEMQRKACHMALVFNKNGVWTGMITLEDAVEEVIGTIEEEYPTEPAVRLSDLLSSQNTFLDVEGDSILSVAKNALLRISPDALPLSREAIMLSVVEREKLANSYIGRGLAIPHARLKNLDRPMVIVARLKSPIPAPVMGEEINLVFLLLTPADLPRIHQILLSHIAGIFESEFLEGRLEAAVSPIELYNTICTAEQVVLG